MKLLLLLLLLFFSLLTVSVCFTDRREETCTALGGTYLAHEAKCLSLKEIPLK